MPKLQRKKSLRNLASVSVLVNDTGSNSTFFQIRELDDILHSGKNSFLIAGTPFLNPQTEVLVEITDALGESIFNQPIKNYAEGMSRVVSIEIYRTVPPGPATLTVLGELRQQEDGRPIPPEWQNRYNVRFQRRLIVDPLRNNDTKLRLRSQPELIVSESLFLFHDAFTGSLIHISSGTAIGVSSNRLVNLNNAIPNEYAVVFEPPILSASMIGADFTVHVSQEEPPFVLTGNSSSVIVTSGDEVVGTSATPAFSFSSSIKDIFNSSTAFLSSSFISGGLFLPFRSQDYTVSFVTPTTFVPTDITRSFAEVRIFPLTTFSGHIERIQLFVKSIDTFGDFEFLDEVAIDSLKLDTFTTASSNIFSPAISLGNFVDQTIFNEFWTGGEIVDGRIQPFSPVGGEWNTTKLLNSVHVVRDFALVETTDSSSVITQNLNSVVVSAEFENLAQEGSLVPRFSINSLVPNSLTSGFEYTYNSRALCVKDTATFEGKFEIYLSGSAFPSRNPFGQLVKTIRSPVGDLSTFFDFDDIRTNVLALANGQAIINLIIFAGDWYFSNISLSLSREAGFHPDEAKFLVPILGKSNEHLQFKALLYNIDSSQVPIEIESDPIFFVGDPQYSDVIDGGQYA